MAILQENWLIMSVITVVSLSANWYFGGRGRRFIWVIFGVAMALLVALLSFELGWADKTTATFAYGILVIYCPLMWMVALRREAQSEA